MNRGMYLIRLLPIFVIVLACSEKKIDSTSETKELQESLPTSFKPKEEVSAPGEANTVASSMLTTRNVLQKVEVLVPKAFKIMDAEMLALKYPSKQGTAFLVYTDEDATVNIAFEHLPNKATLQDLPAIKQVFEQQFNQPQIDFKKGEIKNINGRDFIVIEMITPAIDTEVYNLMFVTSLDGKLLMGTFNCTVEKMQEWQPLAEQILSSVKVKD